MMQPSLAAPRSWFVTVVAWVSMGFTGVGTVLAILQNVMLSRLPWDDLESALASAEGAQHIPAVARFVFSHLRLIYGMFLVLLALAFVASMALLFRKNWARLLFMGLLSLGIAWSIAGMVIPYLAASALKNHPSGVSHVPVVTVTTTNSVSPMVMASMMCLLFAWLIGRLSTRAVRAEFLPNGL